MLGAERQGSPRLFSRDFSSSKAPRGPHTSGRARMQRRALRNDSPDPDAAAIRLKRTTGYEGPRRKGRGGAGNINALISRASYSWHENSSLIM